MMHVLLVFALVVQTGPAAELHLYRFWREPNITSVAGFLTIPVDRLTFTPDSAGERRTCTYQVEVAVRDSSGAVLRRKRWSQQIRIVGRGPLPPDAEAVENLAFDLVPGRYELGVTVTDSLSGRIVELRETIRAAATRPLVSDLVLAREIQAAPDTSAGRPQGSMVRYGTLITPHLQDELPWEVKEISLYAEVYPPADPADSAAHTSIVLRRPGSGFLQETPPRLRRYPAQGGIEMLRLPLAGLEPGEYTLGLKVEYPDTTVLIEQPLALEAAQQPLVLEAAPQPAGGPKPFEDWGEIALDSVFDVVTYIASSQEKRTYRGLPLDAKRRFMHEFWLRRDPAPGPPNEAYEEFMRRVAYANIEFRWRDNPGWKTPRGRIYLTYGPPAERYTHPVADRPLAGRPFVRPPRPFEIWKYMGGRNDKYVFYDQSDMGYYHLLYTTNPYEPSEPNWERLFDSEVLRFIKQF